MPLLSLYTPALEDNERREAGQDYSVDIIAVHGLNEDPIQTWVDHESNVLWLRDLLPKAIRVARVLTYGYNAFGSSSYGKNSVDRIQQHAHTMVADIHANRSLQGCDTRPIIFICHGLGGLLVKKALAYSSTRTSTRVEHLYSVFLSTFAILFFGTPHDGAENVNRLSSPTSPSARTYDESELLLAMKRNSEVSQSISEQFAPLLKQFHIFFFWEQIQSEKGNWTGLIVDESSAAPLIDNTERSGIYATHERMVQFSTMDTPGYRVVIEALLRYCRQAPSIIASRWQRITTPMSRTRSVDSSEVVGIAFDAHNNNQVFNFRYSLQEKQLNKHFHIPQVVSSIYTGREEVSKLVEKVLISPFEADSCHIQRRYVIYGVGGSGKTQFCSKFAQDHRDRFWGIFTIDATSADTAKRSFADIGKIGGLEATQSAGKHWLSHLEEPWLLIIDNADDPSLDLPSLFPEGERGRILVTTRNPNAHIHASVGSSKFAGLHEDEALVLLLRVADVPEPWESETTNSGNKIASTLGYLALALIQAGTLILQRVCGIRDYLSYYAEYRKDVRKGTIRASERDANQLKLYLTWDLSFHSLASRGTQASRDAIQILNIVAFYHHEHIRVDIFTRAVKNRIDLLEKSKPKSVYGRACDAFISRLQAPLVLPEFLRQATSGGSSYRVRQALTELWAFAFISYDAEDKSFSLHPVIHAWARDRAEVRNKAPWAQIALNTLAESILLPPEDTGEAHEEYRRDVLPHLDRCLEASPIRTLDPQSRFFRPDLSAALLIQYTALVTFRADVLNTAKFGYVYAERGHFNNAAIYLLMVKDALVQLRGVNDPSTMKTMLALARTYWGLGRLKEAIALQTVVLDARKAVYGPEEPETLLAMDHLGSSYWLNGQYYEALELQTATREISEKVLGSSDLETLAAMDNLGITLGSWQRYEESVEIHRQVLKMRQEKQGIIALETLTTMNNLAMALLDAGNASAANDLMTKVYEERKVKLGKEHPWTLWALSNLAKAKTQLCRYEEAEEMLVPGIAAAKRSLGDDHLGVLMGTGELARVYGFQGRLQEAENLAVDLIARLEKSRGIEHPDTVYALFKLARLHEMKNDIPKGVETCELALERVHMRLTTKHPMGKQVVEYLAQLKDKCTTIK